MRQTAARFAAAVQGAGSLMTSACLIALLVGLIGCQRTLTESKVQKVSVLSDLSAEKLYPHLKDWGKSGTHGTYYLRGRNSCNTCHGSDLSGGTSKVSCSSCHQGFPHTQEWKLAVNHGAQFLKDANSCKSCHGQDLRGGGVKKSCKECHADFPHESQWALPSKHGSSFLETLKHPLGTAERNTCLKCHATDLPVGDGAQKPATVNTVSCKSCHKTFPHPEPEKWKLEHGSNFVQNKESCKTCHGADLKGGVVGKSCNTCHDRYPHPQDWKLPTGHGASYVLGLETQREAGTRRPKDKDCLFCHTKKEEAPHPASAQNVSCAKCHVGMPHDRKLPVGPSGELKNHVDIFGSLDKKGRVNLVQQCFKCHTNLTEGGTRRNLPYSDGCNMCHGEPVIKGEQKTTYDQDGNPVYEGEVDVVLSED